MDIPPMTRREAIAVLASTSLWIVTGCGKLPWEKQDRPLPPATPVSIPDGSSVYEATLYADPTMQARFFAGAGGDGDPRGWYMQTLQGQPSDYQFGIVLPPGGRSVVTGAFDASDARLLYAPWEVIWYDASRKNTPVLHITSS